MLGAMAALLVLACGSRTAGTVAPSPSSSSPATPSATLTPAEPAPPPSASPAASFSFELPAGTHPVHLHSTCSGSQAFHITTVGDLGGGAQAVTLPPEDTSRGWCLVVYADPSLARVLTFRPV